MRNRLLFAFSFAGILLACMAAYVFGIETPAPPPAFMPASNPYEKGIYANGILESAQQAGANINMYPEVSGRVVEILVGEGQKITQGMPLLKIDASVQQSVTDQQRAQSEAAHALLDALKAQPRKETLLVAQSQVRAAQAALKTAQDISAKLQKSYRIDPQSVSRDALDTARDSADTAKANLEVAMRQYELVKAGAWEYDIRNQEKQADAQEKSYLAAQSLLDKYTLVAPADGVVLAINAAVGGYVSSQGVYNTYTGGNLPVIVAGSANELFNVRCYIDEILVHRLPPADKIKAQMSIRGTDVRIPLEFVRVQPYVSPKIELADQKTERVDVRVLPVIFRVRKPEGVTLYPGQLVDVYVNSQ